VSSRFAAVAVVRVLTELDRDLKSMRAFGHRRKQPVKKILDCQQAIRIMGSVDNFSESASAILLDVDGRFLLQLRDDVPHIRDPGKISLFGGAREGNESFLDCIVREIHEEIGVYLPPERFELIARYAGPDYALPEGILHGEIFLARDIPIEKLSINEGSLKIVTLNGLQKIRHTLALPALYALEIFLRREYSS
jgi:8-oxo-dGTP diphosphatase